MHRGHEIVSHGYRWIDYGAVPEDVERQHIRNAIESLTKLVGEKPVGWMTGRPGPNTRRLVVEEGGFLYDRDLLADELPYWLRLGRRPHLVIPYSYETNDNRFNENSGFSTGEEFFTYMRDAFDVLYREGAGRPEAALHRPARPANRTAGSGGGLIKLLEHMRGLEGVWYCRGIDIAAIGAASFR